MKSVHAAFSQTTQVGIVIVHCGGEKVLEDCIRTLENQSWGNYRIWVVDNGSTDGSAEKVVGRHPGLELIRLKENRGWSGGNNAGIRAALAAGVEWVWLLNNDTLVEPNCLERLMAHAEANPQDMVLSPLVRYAKPSDAIWFAGGKVDTLNLELTGCMTDEEFRGLGGATWPYISGCAMLVQRDVFRRIGFIDERFFLYCEDVDFTVRAWRKGMGLAVVRDAELRHLVSHSTGGMKKKTPQRVYHFFLSTLLFWRKVLGFREFHTRFLRVFLSKRLVSQTGNLEEVELAAYADALWHLATLKRHAGTRTACPAWFRHLLEKKPWVLVAILGFDVGPLWRSMRKRILARRNDQ